MKQFNQPPYMRSTRMQILLKWGVPLAIVIVLFSIFFFVVALIPLKERLIEQKREHTRELTQTVMGIIEEYHRQEVSGLKSRETAQQLAKETIRTLRYGADKSGYFFILDQHMRSVMHPLRRNLEGTDMSQITDLNGKKFIVEMMKLAQDQGEGFVKYLWYLGKDKDVRVPKLTYVMLFKPWGWTVGTGVYVQDIDQAIAAITRNLIIFCGLVLLVVSILGAIVLMRETRFEKLRNDDEQTLRQSEARYRRLYESLRDAFVQVDMAGKIMEFNTTFQEMQGYTPEELRQLTYRDLTPAKWHAFEADIVAKQVLPLGASSVYEKEYIRKDGTILPVELRTFLLTDETGAPSAMSAIIRDISERKRAEEAIKLAEFSIEHSSLTTFWFDRQARVMRVNEATCQALGYDREEFQHMTVRDFDPDFQSIEKWDNIWEVIKSTRNYLVIETRHRRKDGTIFPVEVVSSYFEYAGREFIMSFARDISERKRSEDEQKKLQWQLMQAQKMESVGRLAGGVAHDFNNMLLVILGHAELAMQLADPTQPLYTHLQEIFKAAKRSSDLTRQLLAFARKQTISPQVLDLNALVTNTLKMLQRLIGEDINIAWKPGPELWKIHMDPTQIDQILANLSTNARDAIAGVGELIIETDNVAFDETYCMTHRGFSPGEYVQLTISDTGIGIDKEIIEHMFEPFFTTKEVGKGTGLGLAMVYGIVKQNNGFINVYSEPNHGTTFKIYLPRYVGPSSQIQRDDPKVAIMRGNETVLLVEDEPEIMRVGKYMLESLGYRVLPAGSPKDALRLADEHAGEIHLLITDVVMPEMNGRDLAKRLQSLYPEIRILFMSGYTANVIAHHGVLDVGVNFLPKPFSINDLAAKTRAALAEKPAKS